MIDSIKIYIFFLSFRTNGDLQAVPLFDGPRANEANIPIKQVKERIIKDQ